MVHSEHYMQIHLYTCKYVFLCFYMLCMCHCCKHHSMLLLRQFEHKDNILYKLYSLYQCLFLSILYCQFQCIATLQSGHSVHTSVLRERHYTTILIVVLAFGFVNDLMINIMLVLIGLQVSFCGVNSVYMFTYQFTTFSICIFPFSIVCVYQVL